MKKAEIVADSIANSNRITTFVVHLPRIVLAEFNTHRALSRNSASSRAIPYNKYRKMVKENPFVPTTFLKNHKGMQGTVIHQNQKLCKFWWLSMLKIALLFHWFAEKIGITKQIGNRILEPWTYQKILVTATDWKNFFRLRNHPDAQGEIKEVVEEMELLYNASEPEEKSNGDWHMPFSDDLKDHEIAKQFSLTKAAEIELHKIKICVARCARVSYNNFYGKNNYEDDIKLYDHLVSSTPVHASPTEHVAKVMTKNQQKFYRKIDAVNGKGEMQYGYLRNFKGWIQWRTKIKNDTL